ncbi:hypothetical protein Sru01_27230 [Sphaerisporangium rufum]|uniref:Uncharacterized protein n=1 Tax=Sphaerisporangium rufum TaxID=1381558 RepID=A0A919UY68_9ACTN|nr:hypothetical protein [Sphaerisporangium rufum]GII77741.1 hypothetical protein Sru01_27230 [Sphaerisporangium rufum]
MNRRALDTAARVRVLLAAVAGVAFILLSPALLAADAPGNVTLAVLTMALSLAVLVRVANRCGALAARAVSTVPPGRDDPPPVLPGRVTDPVHHPLRPRAPGPA